MLGVLAEQSVVEEFWDEPEILESDCATTEQPNQCTRWLEQYKVTRDSF